MVGGSLPYGLFMRLRSVSNLCIGRSPLGLSGSGNSDRFRTQWEIPSEFEFLLRTSLQAVIYCGQSRSREGGVHEYSLFGSLDLACTPNSGLQGNFDVKKGMSMRLVRNVSERYNRILIYGFE